MFGEFITPQNLAIALLAVGLPLLGMPELFKGFAWLRVRIGSGKQTPVVNPPASTVGLLEAAQAADTLQRWYSCRCDEAQKKLQEALRHILDPALKPPVPAVNPQLAEQLTRILTGQPTE